MATADLTQVQVDSADLARMAEPMRQYRAFPLGVADASVIAVAERRKLTEIATLDRRHFAAVVPLHAPAFDLLPRP